jgi:YesN/AraC family two-component response regulator
MVWAVTNCKIYLILPTQVIIMDKDELDSATTTSVIYIKHMVCQRCIFAVEKILTENNIAFRLVELGQVHLEKSLHADILLTVNSQLNLLGFEILQNKQAKLIERVKNLIVSIVHHSTEKLQVNLSDYISKELLQDYNYLSNLFSEVEGTTIEKYFIKQRIEKVKELLVYDEHSLAEIAELLNYSSVAYLSNQFKKITGFTPSSFKLLTVDKRKKIDEV